MSRLYRFFHHLHFAFAAVVLSALLLVLVSQWAINRGLDYVR